MWNESRIASGLRRIGWDEYRRVHWQVWPELLRELKKAGISNYTIVAAGADHFSYLECNDWRSTLAFLQQSEIIHSWQVLMADFMHDPINLQQLAPIELLDAGFYVD